jgi:glycosyltransferase involved in cell wall biosynthesis
MNGWFFGDLRTGSGQYALHVTRELLKLGEKVTILLAGNANIEEVQRLLPQAAIKQSSRLSKIDPRLYKIVWEKFEFPRLVSQLSGDIVWTPYLSISHIRTKPHAVTVHDVVFEQYPEYTQGKLATWYLREARKNIQKATSIITISDFSKKEIESFWGTDIPIHIATLASSKPLNPNHTLTSKPNLLYVGGYDVRKNIPTLIDALAIVKKHIPDVKLTLPGRYTPSSLVPDFTSLIKFHKLQDNIIFPGFVSDQELETLFQEARVFVYPSQYEGFGLPILEAMGQGIPVICSGQGAMGEAAGDAAYTVDTTKSQEIATAIREVLTIDSLAQTYQKKGYERVQSFSWEQTAKRVREAFQKTIKIS